MELYNIKELKSLMKWSQDATHIMVIIDFLKKMGVDDWVLSYFSKIVVRKVR